MSGGWAACSVRAAWHALLIAQGSTGSRTESLHREIGIHTSMLQEA